MTKTDSDLNAAIATQIALGGGVVNLAADTYNLSADVGINQGATATNNITLKGQGYDKTIIRPAAGCGDGIIVNGGSNLSFTDITFDGVNQTGVQSVKSLLRLDPRQNNISYVTVQKCQFINIQFQGLWLLSSLINNGKTLSNFTIQNCAFINTWDCNALCVLGPKLSNVVVQYCYFQNMPYLQHSHSHMAGLDLWTYDTGVVVHSNVFLNAPIYNARSESGAYFGNANHTIISNNDCVGSQFDCIGIQAGDHITVQNNVVKNTVRNGVWIGSNGPFSGTTYYPDTVVVSNNKYYNTAAVPEPYVDSHATNITVTGHTNTDATPPLTLATPPAVP